MTLYEFRAARGGHGFAGYIEAATLAAAIARLTALGFSDPSYLASATDPEPGAPIYR